MQAFRHWSVGKLILISVALFFVMSIVVVLFLFLVAGTFFFDSSTGSGSLGAVSIARARFGFSVPTLLIPTVPPVALIVGWLVARRRGTQ